MNNYLTEEAINILKEEIEHRKVVVRHQIIEEIKTARAHGDLSENYEYKAAKRERGINESRIRYLERMIRTAKIIEDTTSADEVGLGKTVKIRFINDNETELFTIVTTVETDLVNNKISIESPLGRAIYNHKVGDEILIDSPNGTYPVLIEEVLLNASKELNNIS